MRPAMRKMMPVIPANPARKSEPCRGHFFEKAADPAEEKLLRQRDQIDDVDALAPSQSLKIFASRNPHALPMLFCKDLILDTMIPTIICAGSK
jgi:hypothetical protein